MAYKGSRTLHRQHGRPALEGISEPCPILAPRMDVGSWLGIGQASVLVQRARGAESAPDRAGL